MSKELHFQGVPISEIASEFGTPLYVYDSSVLNSVYTGLRDRLHQGVDIFFSLKANPNISMCSYLGGLGAGAEVSSMTELVTAQRAGIAAEDTIFLGPGKTSDELKACVDAGLHAVVVESIDELLILDDIAGEAGRQVRAMIRVNPDFHAKGSGLAMGGKPRQFGVDAGVLRGASRELAGLHSVQVVGLHAYMGTRFLHHADVVRNTMEILAAAQDLSSDLGIDCQTVDFGGGLGVAYFDNEQDIDVEALALEFNQVVDDYLRSHPGTKLIMELGRYLTAMAGTYVTQALYVKESMGERFVVADGGTNHHMAAVGIGSFVKRNFPIRSLTRYDDVTEIQHRYTVSGPLCTPNDVIGKRVHLPEVIPGDLIGVERSGAYGPSASPADFLSHGRPAEVLVHKGVPHLVREPDGVDELLARQRLIEF